MLRSHTYDAYLEDNILTWVGEPPRELPVHERALVKVTIDDLSVQKKGDGKVIAEILEKIAANGHITNEWIKEWEEANQEGEEHELARAKKSAEILKKLSKLDPFRDIDDPVEWQREIREDRKLLGRD